MTEVSLSASIFGDKKDEKNTLSNLFTKVSDLPATPNNVNFLESTTERTKREKKEEKRKKRKNKYENEDEETNTSIDDKNKTLPEEPSVKKVKKRKVKSDDKKEEEDATGGDNQSEVIEEGDEARTIFVGNLPLDITREKLKSIFKECGKIKSARLRSFSTTGVKVAPEHAGNQVRLSCETELFYFVAMRESMISMLNDFIYNRIWSKKFQLILSNSQKMPQRKLRKDMSFLKKLNQLIKHC
jgi:RNA recognition motif-containing protein